MSASKFRIAIIGGCGHVGLPLGIVFASRPGFEVTLVDINQHSVDEVNAGRLHFQEEGGEEELRKVIGKTLTATTQPQPVAEADCVIFVTGTPVDEHLNPRVGDVLKVVNFYLPHMRDGQLVVLRSTLFPGVTELVARHIQAARPKIGVSFCPERVAQGFAIKEIITLPQIVSAFDTETEDRAAKLFGAIAPEILRMTTAEAELVKLFANTWRYIEFAISNQHYMIAESSGVDFNRVYHGLTHHYPRAKSFARPGLTAGPCLFKDTMQLSAFHKNNYFLGHAAMLVNEGLPNFLVESLEKKIGPLVGKRVGLLGMGFKANNDDIRESLSYKLKKVLELRGATVLDTDVFQETASLLPKILEEADALVLGVPHNEYRRLDLKGKPFVDCWGVWENTPDLNMSAHPTAPRLKKAA